MLITETIVRTVKLDCTDIKQAIIMYLKERGERNIKEEDITLSDNGITATVTLKKELDNKQKPSNEQSNNSGASE